MPRRYKIDCDTGYQIYVIHHYSPPYFSPFATVCHYSNYSRLFALLLFAIHNYSLFGFSRCLVGDGVILINALHVGFWIEQSGLNQPLVRILVFSLHVGTVHIKWTFSL